MKRRPSGGDYDVGYGKPPKASQFRPGQINNPKGRPKGHRNFATTLHQKLQGVVRTGDGKKIKVQDALCQNLLAAALRNETKALMVLLPYLRAFGQLNLQPDDAPGRPLTSDDPALIADFVARVNESGALDQGHTHEDSGTGKQGSADKGAGKEAGADEEAGDRTDNNSGADGK